MRTVKTSGGITLLMEKTEPAEKRAGHIAITDPRVNEVACVGFAHWLLDWTDRCGTPVSVTMPAPDNLEQGFYGFRLRVVDENLEISLPPDEDIESAWEAILSEQSS